MSDGAHRPDLGTLVTDHTLHGRRADKRRQREEKNRENGCDTIYDLRIVIEADIADIRIALQDIVIRRGRKPERRKISGDCAGGIHRRQLCSHRFFQPVIAGIHHFFHAGLKRLFKFRRERIVFF